MLVFYFNHFELSTTQSLENNLSTAGLQPTVAWSATNLEVPHEVLRTAIFILKRLSPQFAMQIPR